MKKETIASFLKNLSVQVIGGLITTIFCIYLLQKQILDFISYIASKSVPLWIAIICGIIIVFVLLLSIVIYNKKKRSRASLAFASFRMRTGFEQQIPLELYGVRWIASIPRQPILGDPDEYVWLDGPFCPECNFELKWEEKRIFLRRRYYWFCKRCNKNFERPPYSTYQTKEDIENICYADIFRKKKFQKREDL